MIDGVGGNACPRRGLVADTDEAGHAFQSEAGHPYRSEAGHRSDLMSATGGSERVNDIETGGV